VWRLDAGCTRHPSKKQQALQREDHPRATCLEKTGMERLTQSHPVRASARMVTRTGPLEPTDLYLSGVKGG